MPVVELLLPRMGESVMEATIINWLKKEGDQIEEDEFVLEVSTDKVDTEIPSPVSGRLSKILHKVNDVVAVGKPLALISVEGGDEPVEMVIEKDNMISEAKPQPQSLGQENRDFVKNKKTISQPTKAISSSLDEYGSNIPSLIEGRFYSPLVRNIAQVERVSPEELKSITGTGGNDRVTKRDLCNYIERRTKGIHSIEESHNENRKSEDQPSSQVNQSGYISNSETSSFSDREEIIEMDRMRRIISDHMTRSKQISAHVTSFVEVDVTKMVHWRNGIKDDFNKKYKQKLTFTPLFAEAVIRAILDFPRINSSVGDNKIILKKYINLGIATALPSGNLIVPIIKNSEDLSLMGLAKKTNDLIQKARSNRLTPDEVSGGTFTISNIGTFGNIMGTPIINQPQVAVLALGVITKKPVILETAEGDTIAIRHMMYLSLSYDHRIIDGFLGGSFLKRIAENIEAFDPHRKV